MTIQSLACDRVLISTRLKQSLNLTEAGSNSKLSLALLFLYEDIAINFWHKKRFFLTSQVANLRHLSPFEYYLGRDFSKVSFGDLINILIFFRHHQRQNVGPAELSIRLSVATAIILKKTPKPELETFLI